MFKKKAFKLSDHISAIENQISRLKKHEIVKHFKFKNLFHPRQSYLKKVQGMFEWKWVLIAIGSMLLFLGSSQVALASHTPSFTLRSIASSYPQVKSMRDEDDILDHYPEYLEFVVRAASGSRTSKKWARLLQKNYAKLKQQSPTEAARFLRGLRYELDEILNLRGMSTSRLSHRNKVIRRVVYRNIRNWAMEADEHWFRSIALRASNRNA